VSVTSGMKLSDLDLLSIGNTIGLAGAVFRGEGKVLLCMFPEERGEVVSGESFRDSPEFVGLDGERASVEALDMDRDDWQKFLRQTDILETEVLQHASDGTLAKVILRKSARQIEAGVSWQVFRRDGYACRYCGKDDVPLTVDHLVLWEEGGPSIPENLVSACRKCNKARGRTQYGDWLSSPYYAKVSAGLGPDALERNRRLTETLGSVPRMKVQRSR